MAQSHNCAYLVSPGDQCRCDESCQYMLTTYNRPCGPMICGKDQITGHVGGNDPRIDALTERVDAAVRELSNARQKVAAAKEVIRENIDLRDAIATLQTELQHERGNRADMEREYRGKLAELHRSFEIAAQALEDGRVKCAGLEKENAAIRVALKAVL